MTVRNQTIDKGLHEIRQECSMVAHQHIPLAYVNCRQGPHLIQQKVHHWINQSGSQIGAEGAKCHMCFSELTGKVSASAKQTHVRRCPGCLPMRLHVQHTWGLEGQSEIHLCQGHSWSSIRGKPANRLEICNAPASATSPTQCISKAALSMHMHSCCVSSRAVTLICT